jgi:hypothetical protein
MEPVKGKSFAFHQFAGSWQTKQYMQLKENLPPNTTLLVLDFGRNIEIKHQEEAKEAGFSSKQVTIHPVVMHYHVDGSPVKCRDTMIFLSDDISHDHKAVNHFLKKQIKVDKVYIFTDGCSSQYKGKGTVADMSQIDTNIEWNYFGSDHGKGEADAEVGVVNRALERAIIGKHIILNDASDVYNWCKDDLAYDAVVSKRHFYLSNEIPRDTSNIKLQPFLGIRKIHLIANTDTPFSIKTRAFSCYCK